MKKAIRPALFAVLYILFTVSLRAQDFPRIEPSPWTSEIGSLKGRPSVSRLIDAAFYASGLGKQDFPEYRRKINSLLSGLQGYMQEKRGTLPPGEAVLHYLHERLFTLYAEPQTLIHVSLDTGRYNCVSSAVLYTIAARHVGLQVEGVVTPDHAFCRVIENGTGTDVETTNPYGYNPGQKREFINAFGQTGFTYVPPGKYHLRTSIDERELIGLILQNRISRAQRENRIDLAVPLAVDRYAMTRTERTKAEMIKEFVNFTSVLNGERRFDEAFDFLDAVRLRWGNHDEDGAIIDTLLYNSTVIAGREGREDEALDRLSFRYEQGDLSEETFRDYRYTLGEGLIYRYSKAGDPLESLAELERLRQQELISDSIYREYRAVLHIQRAKEISRDQGDLEALDYFRREGLQSSADPRLRQALEVFTHNAAAFYHNRFVSLFREKRYREAELLIQEGLEKLYGNPLLLKDQQILRQTQNR